MASKPINPQPLQMPSLSQLPDPFKDLMGGTDPTNPTSLMSVSQQGINDLFAPKPINAELIKPSAEASAVLQAAQQQVQAQASEVEKARQQQQLEMVERQKRETERRIKENLKLAEKLRKEQEKALKKKKEQQGGKLGAAPDGSFVLTQNAQAIITSPEWKAIKSDMQRNDQMNNWLKEVENDLRKRGVADDIVKAEIDHARKIITDDTRQYVKGMRDDRTDLHDLGLSVVKGLAPLSNLVGAIGVENITSFGLNKVVANTLKFAGDVTGIDGLTSAGNSVDNLGGLADKANTWLQQFGTDLSNAMDEAKSKTIQLDKANNDYLNQKSAELNPNRGWFERAGDTLANIHKSGNKFSTAVDLAGVAIPALLTGGGTALASQGAGRATIAFAGRFAQGGLANKGLTFVGNQVAKHGASVGTVAAYGGGDAAQSAWDGVMNASFDNIKSGYISAYGESDWNALVKKHSGNKDAIKRDIASNSAEYAVAAFVPMAVLAAPLGLESMVARTVAGKSNAVAGSKLLAIGAAGVSEGIEEGLTTFAGNYAQHGGGTLGTKSSITGTTLDAGVPEAAAIGAVAGVGLATPLSVVEGKGSTPSNFSAKNIDVGNYVTDGNLNQQLFEQEVMRAFYAEKRSALNQGMSEAQASAYLQLQYNQYIDNDHTWNAMHSDVQAAFKKKMATEFGISSNNYAMYRDTATAKAFASGDINQVKALNDDHVLNAFRMAHGVETDLVPAEGRVYYQALANVMKHLENADKNVNTKGRHAQYVSYTNDENSPFHQFKTQLTREDLASIDQYVMTVLDAGQRRLTDQQQQQYEAVQQAAEAVREQQAQAPTSQNNPQGTNNDTNQQTDQNQSAGQDTPAQNAEPVPSQSGGAGGTDQQTTDNQTQVESDNAGGATVNPAQGSGDGLAGQGTDTSPTTDPTDQNRADPDGNRQGARQTPNTGNSVDTPATTSVSGQVTQQGIAGQADQDGQPVRQIRPSTTQETVSGGGVGVTPTERSADDRSNQAPTKAGIEKSLFESGAEISDTDIQLIVNGLTSNLKKSLAYPELRDNITIPDGKALSDYSVAQALAALPNEQFNVIFVPALGAKSMRTGRGKTIRNTYIAIIKGYAQLIYDRQLAQYRSEQDARRQAEREQNAQARADEQARIQRERAEQKAETDRIKAELKAQREAEKAQARLDKQAERDRQAQEKAQALEQKKITDADVANTKAQQILQAKQETLREKELTLAELNDSRTELVTQLENAKEALTSAKETVRNQEKQVKAANKAVDKADKAWRKELEKTKRAELKEQWVTDKNAANRVKGELTKAIKDLELANKTVTGLNKKIKALDVKLKKAKQAVAVANREVVSARTTADKAEAKLNALRGVQTDEQTTSATDTTVVDEPQVQAEQSADPNLDNLTEQEQPNATQDDLGQSVQPTQEQPADGNEIIRERTDDEPTDEQPREVYGQSDQQDVTQQETSAEQEVLEPAVNDAETNNLELTEPLLASVTSKQIAASYPNAGLTTEEKNAIGTGKASIPAIKEMLTVPQAGLTDVQVSALNKLADHIRSGKSKVKTAPTDSQVKQTASKQSVDVIADVLDSNPELVENAEQALEKMGLDVSVEEFVRDVLSADFTSKDVETVLNSPDKFKTQLGKQTKPSDVADEIDYEKAKNEYEQIRRGGSITNQQGAVSPDFLLALPNAILKAIQAVWNAIKNNFAKVSMAVAITAGSTFTVPTEANAATPTEAAVVQNIVSQNDNQGKQFIIADKQAGTLTLYTPQGQEITSTPALFGKVVGDSTKTNNATPSGRFDLTFVDGKNIDGKGYGSSAQALSVNGKLQENNAGNVAIHRVLPIENRKAKLASETATDNRVSHGCINVPSTFYDTHLDRKQDTVVYVMPETDTGRTGVFDTPAVDKTTPVANVAKEMDNANGQSVEVTPAQITNATPYSAITRSPVVAAVPVKIAGTTPSGQIANVMPTVVGGVTITQIDVPFKVATPAEMQANGVFDTDPISANDRTDDGLSIYDIVLGILGAKVVATGISRRRKKLRSKNATTEQDGDSVPANDISSGSMSQDQAQDTVDTNHNQQAKANKRANGTSHVRTDVQAPPQKTALVDAISREMWVKYMSTQSHNTRTSNDGQVTFLEDLAENLDLLGYTYDVVMSDPTIEQINNGTFATGREWKFTDPTDSQRTGISATMMNFMAGVTQNFDNLMHRHGIARGGYEADSSLPSIHLAQVRAKASGAYAQIHKLFVKPLFRKIDNLAVELRTGIIGLEADIGRVATLRHVLNEGADALWRAKETLIAERQAQLAAVQAELARTPDGQQYSITLASKADMLSKEITNLQDTLDNARDMYEGKTAWDGETKLPGGYTKARAEQELADIKAKYGDEFSKIENLAKETAKTVLHIRQFATASGVFTNADLDAFNEIGFKEYVPLYKEQKDNRIPDETDNDTQTSMIDRLVVDIPAQQARAMGLTKDLSRYAREGSTEIAADGITNLKLFSMNMAGRIGQQQWVQSVQQLYEGNVGKPFSEIANMTEQELIDLNASADSGKLPGLVRIRPGMEEFLPSELRDPVKIGNVKPIIAKGFNSSGNLVTYHYYFTEPTIQNEVYVTADLTDTLVNKFLQNVGTVTRAAARFMTTFKPVWNVYNYVRDSFERISVMLMRPVKDRNGNLVNRWDLTKSYFGNLVKISSSLPVQKEIYRYLVLGEVKTKIQRDLHEAVGSGAINLMTSQTEKHSVLADIKKSNTEKLANEAVKMLGEGMNKLGAGKARQLVEQGLDLYVMRLTEVPQITTALASYLAYKDVGVNQTETANRVRDQYDPLRVGNKHISDMTTLYPFIRSTFSGHYNLHRSLTEYWGAGEWQFTALYAIGATLGAIGLFAMISGRMGDDEDGVPKMARLPTSTLMAGIPIPIGDDGVWSMPVGFGMNKLFLGVGANIFKQWNGWQEGNDTAKNLIGLVADNTSPIQMASSKAYDENPVAATVLSFVPTVLKPIVELGFNVNSFRGGKIISRDTPRDQHDHLQDNFNVPEDYKHMVTWLHKMSGGAVDMRPETLKYLFDGYGNMTGPFSAIPKAILQDKGEKTLDNARTKGEHFNPFLVAIGADMAIQPNALEVTSHTYAMQDLRYELHRRYGVGETHSEADYDRTATTGPRGGSNNLKAWELTKLKLEEQNAPQEVIDYIVNGMKYSTARKKLDSQFKDLANEYYRAKVNGTDTPQMRIALQDAWDNLENLTDKYVMENNRAYYELRK